MPLPATTTHELVLEIANQPGTLGRLTQLLGKEEIDVLGFAAVASGDTGTLHMITDDAKRAEEVLEESGYVPRTREALLITLPGNPGMLGRYANRLGTHDVNIEASFIIGHVASGRVRCAFSVDNVDEALRVAEELD